MAAPPEILPMETPPGPRVRIDGVEYDYFGGTSYLGLHADPELLAAAQRALQQYGLHAATSRTRYINPSLLASEAAAARYFGTEDALHFVSGYASNLILCQALEGTVDLVVCDEHAHFALRDAARWLGVPIQTFAHRDPEDLRRRLDASALHGQRILLLSDGVFASFGGIAPLDAYLEALAGHPGSALLLDEAHAYGVLGEQGRGTFEHFGLFGSVNQKVEPGEGTRLYSVGTLSKALGGHGGLIPGSKPLLDAVRRASGLHGGASSPTAPACAAAAAGMDKARQNPSLRSGLRSRVLRVRRGLRDLGIDIEDLPTPILGFVHGDAARMRQLHRDLCARGVLVPYASAYAGVGPEGAMRLAVFANHSEAQIDHLLDSLKECL